MTDDLNELHLPPPPPPDPLKGYDSMEDGNIEHQADRRSRRSAVHTSAFRAIKARQSGGHSPMQVFARILTEKAPTIGLFFFQAVALSIWLVWILKICEPSQLDLTP